MKDLKRTWILSLLFLTACAPSRNSLSPETNSLANPPTPSQESTPSQPLTKDMSGITSAAATTATTVSSWNISGAMAARNSAKAWSASLNWQQQGINNYQIRLSGPLGGGTVLIEKQGGMVTFKDGPKTASSKSADELLQKQTGIRLPVNNLYYWVRGLSAPGSVQSIEHDAGHRIVRLQQAGYSINYLSYTTIGNISLPSKIEMHGQGVTIKLVIKKWNV